MRSKRNNQAFKQTKPQETQSEEYFNVENNTKDSPPHAGYSKEQIRVQIDQHGKLRVSGERPLEDNRWSRFRKDFIVPEKCNIRAIRARFENGRLYVTLPKLIADAKGQEQPTQAPQKPEESQKPTTEPKPSTLKDDMNHKASVKPDGVTKKQEDEKGGAPIDARKDEQKVREKEKDQTEEKKYDEQKVREKEKDQTEEKKYDEKVAGVVKREEVEKGDAVTDVGKKEAVSEPAANGEGRNGRRKLKRKVGELDLGFYKSGKMMVNAIVAAMVLVGLGLYKIYKLSRPVKEDGH